MLAVVIFEYIPTDRSFLCSALHHRLPTMSQKVKGQNACVCCCPSTHGLNHGTRRFCALDGHTVAMRHRTLSTAHSACRASRARHNHWLGGTSLQTSEGQAGKQASRQPDALLKAGGTHTDPRPARKGGWGYTYTYIYTHTRIDAYTTYSRIHVLPAEARVRIASGVQRLAGGQSAPARPLACLMHAVQTGPSLALRRSRSHPGRFRAAATPARDSGRGPGARARGARCAPAQRAQRAWHAASRHDRA
jgi:hypothetical protein